MFESPRTMNLKIFFSLSTSGVFGLNKGDRPEQFMSKPLQLGEASSMNSKLPLGDLDMEI